jgi:Transglutaminase-like superfamily
VHGNRIHKLDVSVGNLKVEYAAAIVGRTAPAPVTEYDLSMYLRPSRYAEADKFYGFAPTEFGSYIDSTKLLEKLASWVGIRLNYVPGSSDSIDGAVDTLLAGAGVCRDFAHLVVVAGRERAGPGCVGVCTGAVSDGLSCGGRGFRGRAVAGS